jgi:hypothetical protein
MLRSDILLLVRKIVIGLLLAVIPFLIFYAGFWLMTRFG